jgi:hypothetical protein
MKTFYKIILKYICRRLVIQGHSHKANISEYYGIMYQAAAEEFTEDNKPTLDDFLQKRFDESKINF